MYVSATMYALYVCTYYALYVCTYFMCVLLCMHWMYVCMYLIYVLYMYVCMYVCMYALFYELYILTVHTSIRTYIHVHKTNGNIHIHNVCSVCMCILPLVLCTCMYVRMYVCMYVYGVLYI